jgi:hypothetical protein
LRETRTFTALAIGALILVMAAMLASPAQARPPLGEIELKPPVATIGAPAALSVAAMQRIRAATS